MIAICDCNAFYAACHQLWDARIWDKPVVVLSNNKGVIVSLNKKAKALGLERGMKEFEHAAYMDHHGVVRYESNYELYDDMSARVILTIADLVEIFEINSIDEAFLYLKGYARFGYEKYCRYIVETIKRITGIAVSIGVGATKTLSKIANRFSKKISRFKNVFVIDTEEKRMECLKRTKIADVWGIGKELGIMLNAEGIVTAWDFVTKISRKRARKLYSVELERTWLELQGICCYPITPEVPEKKSIATTRSFPVMIEDKITLRQAISTYSAICAANLRDQNAYAAKIRVFLNTNRYRENLPQYNPSMEITLSIPSNSTLTLSHAALKVLDEIYLPGYKYKKAGVEVIKIEKHVQASLMDDIQIEFKRSRISKVEDFYSHGFHRHLLSLAVEGYKPKGQHRDKIDLKEDNPLKCPTTRFQHILEIDCTGER